MPLYEYQCGKCGRFEIIQRFADGPLGCCPTCGGEVQKLLSAPAIQFKGTGWYITDYARKSSGAEAGSKPSDAAKSSSQEAGPKDKPKSSSSEATGKEGSQSNGSTLTSK